MISPSSAHVGVKHPDSRLINYIFFVPSAHWEHNLLGELSQSLSSVATGSGAALGEGV